MNPYIAILEYARESIRSGKYSFICYAITEHAGGFSKEANALKEWVMKQLQPWGQFTRLAVS